MSPDPSREPRTLGFVDAGRLGASLALALRRIGHPVVAVSRRDPDRAAALATRIDDDVVGTSDPQRVVSAANVVFVTTVDDRLEDRVAGLEFRAGQTVVHCSGATPVEVLAPARRAGARIGGFHPLQTFPDDHGADRLAGVTFGVEAEDRTLLEWLGGVAEALGGVSVELDARARPLYHASAVMVGPLVSGLAGLAGDLWSAFGHDRDTGVRALAPLLRATAEHVAVLGVPEALTGPYARGDVEPVRAHLDALADVHGATARAYAALALAQLPIAEERGNIPEDRMHALRELLEGALA